MSAKCLIRDVESDQASRITPIYRLARNLHLLYACCCSLPLRVQHHLQFTATRPAQAIAEHSAFCSKTHRSTSNHAGPQRTGEPAFHGAPSKAAPPAAAVQFQGQAAKRARTGTQAGLRTSCRLRSVQVSSGNVEDTAAELVCCTASCVLEGSILACTAVCLQPRMHVTYA